jgi:hypothetical protein
MPPGNNIFFTRQVFFIFFFMAIYILRYNDLMMRNLFIYLFAFHFQAVAFTAESKQVPSKAILTLGTDSFYDQNFDYSHFSGRVTDRDVNGSILKVSSETKNVRFFHAGDFIEFKIQTQPSAEFCQGYVRSIEENYFVMFVKDIAPCFSNSEYFRRGTALVMHSEKLAERIKEASVYREGLIRRKKDYMQQLNGINQYLWNFEENKIQVAAEFDRKIIEIEKEKMRALGQLLTKKNDDIRLQKELITRLEGVDREFDFYRIDKDELMFDRWHLDHDLGPPVYEKPVELRLKTEHVSN